MEINRKAVLCKTKREFFELHLNIMNSLLSQKFTEKEIVILASFMSIDEKLVEDDRFNTLVRKKVRTEHKLSAGGLGNYLKSMLDKGYLTKSKITGRLKIKSILMPALPKQGYEIKIGYRPVEEVKKEVKEETVKAEIAQEVPNNFASSEVIHYEENDDDNDEPAHKM